MKENAIYSTAQGLSVFPVFEPREDGLGCSCKLGERCQRPGKHPRINTGVKAATRDREIIGRWWTRWPAASIGVSAGRSGDDGLLFLDIDPRNKGSLAALPLTEADKITPSFITGGGGIQLIFSAEGRDVKASNALIKAPGIDVRSGDSYSIFPPSRHISGRCYQWVHGRAWGEVPVRPLSEKLLGLLVVREASTAPELIPPPPEELLSTSELHPYVTAILHDSLEKLSKAQVGMRNSTLNFVGFSLFQLSGAGLLSATDVEAVLTTTALSIGLEADEIARTLASAKAGAKRKPRKVWPKDLS
jgi:hypothetical protein